MQKLFVRGQDAPSLPRLFWDVPIFSDGKLAGVKRRLSWVLPSKPNNEYRVLVVNDDKDITWMFAELLKYRGYQVAVAFDGVRGLALTREYKPDLLLLNVMMPGLDGFSVLEKLRGDELTAGTRVIIHSGAGRRAEDACRVLGVEFMDLPVGPAELCDRVARALRV